MFDVVTERKRTEKSLRLLSRAVEQSAVPILITDSVGSIEYVNAKFTEQSGYAQAEVIGKNPKMLKSGTTPREVYQRRGTRSSGETSGAGKSRTGRRTANSCGNGSPSSR